MCNFKSAEAALIDGELKLFVCDDEDSHTAIRKRHHIREDNGCGLGNSRHTPIELAPVRGLFKLEDYSFIFDAGRPDWWTDNHTTIATRLLWSEVEKCLETDSITHPGTLSLGKIKSLPVGLHIAVGGGLYLGSVTSLDGVTLPQTVGSDLDLGSVTSLDGVTLPQTVGSGLYLGSVTSLDGVTLPQTVGGGLYLRSVTSLDEAIVQRFMGKIRR